MSLPKNWIQKDNNLVNLHKVTGITIDTKGQTQEHIGTIKFTYETGATNFKYGTMKDEENKKQLQDVVKEIERITTEDDAWVRKDNKIVNLDNVNGIIIKRNVNLERENQILFVYIAGGTDFTYSEDEKAEFNNMINTIKAKVGL